MKERKPPSKQWYIGAILGIIAIFLMVTACATHESAGDPKGVFPGTNAVVIQEPYGFRNVSFSCFGHVGIYVTSRSISDSLPSGVTVNPNDEHCK